MLSTLIAVEDENLLARIRSILSADHVDAFFSSEAEEAADIIQNNDIAIAILSLSFSVMDGGELAEFCMQQNSRTQLILLYSEQDTEYAVSFFNAYENCKIISYDLFKPMELSALIWEAEQDYSAESALLAQEEKFFQKESQYKKKLMDMSGLLNDRNEGYSAVIRQFLMSFRLLFDVPDDPALDILMDHLTNVLNEYVQLFLVGTVTLSDIMDYLNNQSFDAEEMKYYHLETTGDIIPADYGTDSSCDFAFLLYLCVETFHLLAQHFRSRVNVSIKETEYRADLIYDVRVASENQKIFGYMCTIMESLGKNFSDKFLYGSKDGVIQYRMICNRNI